MVITPPPELAEAITRAAERAGKTPEEFALEILRRQVVPIDGRDLPHDEWMARLRAIGVDCGVSLSDEALSREEIYD